MANASIYDKRDLVRITASFEDSAGDAADPSGGVVIEVKDPELTVTGYAYGLSSQGNWDADANSPTLVDGTGTAGYYYTVTVAGAVDFGSGSITFEVGDYVYYNGYIWQRLQNPSSTAITKNGTGSYFIDVYGHYNGPYHYRVEGLGTGQSADENHFNIAKSEIP